MLHIYNTLSRTKEPLRPVEPGKVRMYVCGMTVYDYCHLGHARMLVGFDVVQRWLRASGYDVTRDPDWPLLREVRELKLVVSAVPLLASTPGVAAEFRIRLTSIMDGDENVRWTPYADLTRPSGGDRRP